MKKIMIILVISLFLIAGCGKDNTTTTIQPEQPATPSGQTSDPDLEPDQPDTTPEPEVPAPTLPTSNPDTTDDEYDDLPGDVHAPDINEQVAIRIGNVKFTKFEARNVEEGAYIHGEVENTGDIVARNIPIYAKTYFNREDIANSMMVIDSIGVGEKKEFSLTLESEDSFNSFLVSFEEIGELGKPVISIDE